MLLLRGLTSKEIADEMRISPSTVKSFLKLVMTKVGATSRTRSSHHYTVGGELEVEELEALASEVEEVSCRWCGNGSAVVAFDPSEAAAD